METCRFNTKESEDGIRQGNENEEIDVYTYVTEGTFDAYLYQLVENKQKFISQIMTSKAIVRSAEDIDEKALSYAEIKALAAGNPLIIEKTELDTQVSKLKLLKQNYLSEIYKLEDLIAKHYPAEINNLQNKIKDIEKDIEIVKQNTQIENTEKFSPMILKGTIYKTKEQAGKELLEICKNKENVNQEEIGEYRGLKMYLEINVFSKTFELKLKNNSSYIVNLGTDIYGNITRIDNVITNMKEEQEKAKIDLIETEKQLENAKIDVKVPFDKEDELREKSNKLDKLNILLNLNEKDNEIIDDEEQEQEQENEKKNREPNKDKIR